MKVLVSKFIILQLLQLKKKSLQGIKNVINLLLISQKKRVGVDVIKDIAFNSLNDINQF